MNGAIRKSWQFLGVFKAAKKGLATYLDRGEGAAILLQISSGKESKILLKNSPVTSRDCVVK